MHEELADWIRKQVQSGCARIKLLQRVKEVDRTIGDWLLPPKVDVDGLSGAILAVVTREAGKLPQSSLYGAFSFRAGASRHSDYKLWRAHEAGALASNTPPEGLAAAMPRPIETTTRIALKGRALRESPPEPKPETTSPKRRAVTTKRAAARRGKKPPPPRRT